MVDALRNFVGENMGKLLNLAVYNPAILSDEDFIAGFVAREDLLTRLVERLRETSAARSAKHFLILGQRGMGKTSLLRRLALSVQDDPAMRNSLLPLTFREEQYNIHNLNIFWCNCLDALGDWFEKNGEVEKAAEIDRDVAKLIQAGDDPEGNNALEIFIGCTKREKRRALLLIDNIDLVLDAISQYQWNLRRALQIPNGMIVVGASAGYTEATADKDAAFYDFFQVVVLEKLNESELMVCLRRLAKLRGDDGQKALKAIDADSGRIRTLYNLTGGNPRTLTLLYLLLELDADGDVLSDLDRLLDQSTALYKARVEDLAPQSRVVLDAVALSWDPATAADIAEITNIGITAVSAQLDRLQKNGIIEKTSISSTPRAAFQLSERFFNIWYLMRHGARRQRNRLRWLTCFLKESYSPQQLVERARNLLLKTSEHSIERGHYYLAISNALEDKGWRYLLAQEARKEMELYAGKNGLSLDDIVDPDDLPIPITVDDWMNQGHLLKDHLKRYEKAEHAYRRAIELDPQNAWTWDYLGTLLYEKMGRINEGESALRKAIELDPQLAWAWKDLAQLLQVDPNRYEEAEIAYRNAIRLNPKNVWFCYALGEFLSNRLNRYHEAEAVYRQAIENDPKNAWGWDDLAYLLFFHLEKYGEAETAIRRAVELAPQEVSHHWRFGYLFLFFLNKLDEAENALKKALSLDPLNTATRIYWFIFNQIQPNHQSEVCKEFENIIQKNLFQLASVLRSIKAVTEDNFGEAVKSFEDALINYEDKLFNMYSVGFLILFLRQIALRDYGEKLLAYMDERGISDRYWPLRAAFDAYLHGEAKLMDVNPEVRGPARQIYGWLACDGNAPTSKPKSKPQKRGKRKKAGNEKK
jgi:tetratricopeptide (TPR) repeat protein